jgi:hypothetical protein
MSTMTIPVSDVVLSKLREQASKLGITPEELAAEKLSFAANLSPGYGRLRKLAGSMPSDITDASERCDEYLSD